MRIVDNKMLSASSVWLSRLSLASPILFALLAMLWTVTFIQQPLWVDELHSGWVVAGDWQDVPERAARGNQSSDFFWLLKALCWIGPDQSTWLIRVPSILAWTLTVATAAWVLLRQVGASGAIIAVACCLAILLDPMQCFYAVEARVYATVQCLNVWSWLMVSLLVQCHCTKYYSVANQTSIDTESSTACPATWKWWLWTILVVMMVRLHITSGLSAMMQGAILAVIMIQERLYASGQLQVRTDKPLITLRPTMNGYRWNAWLCLSVVLTSSIWTLVDHRSIWMRRKLWQSFAGDGSLQALATLLPWSIFLVPIICLGLLQLLRLIANQLHQQRSHLRYQSPIPLILWTVAAVGPYGLAWLVTRFQIAPIFHYRFIISSAIPLYIAGGLLLHWFVEGKPWHRAIAAVLLVAAQLYWQGIIDLSSGRLELRARWGNQRSEDWSQSVSWVSRNAEPDSTLVFCYAGLVEGVGLSLPLDPSMDEYLSYPLRGPYRISRGQAQRQPHGLTADRSSWRQQILAQADGENGLAIWIVYRGAADSLTQDLNIAGLGNLQSIHPVKQFGKVSAICLSWEQ